MQVTDKALYNLVKKYHVTKLLFVSYFIALALIIYFLFITIFGQKGLIEYFSLKNQIENKEAIKEELLNKMNVKKNMVDGMNTNSLDIDLLDEQARKNLGYVGKNEVVIYQDNKNQGEQNESKK
jgi:cell division protein FtsB